MKLRNTALLSLAVLACAGSVYAAEEETPEAFAIGTAAIGRLSGALKAKTYFSDVEMMLGSGSAGELSGKRQCVAAIGNITTGIYNTIKAIDVGTGTPLNIPFLWAQALHKRWGDRKGKIESGALFQRAPGWLAGETGNLFPERHPESHKRLADPTSAEVFASLWSCSSWDTDGLSDVYTALYGDLLNGCAGKTFDRWKRVVYIVNRLELTLPELWYVARELLGATDSIEEDDLFFLCLRARCASLSSEYLVAVDRGEGADLAPFVKITDKAVLKVINSGLLDVDGVTPLRKPGMPHCCPRITELEEGDLAAARAVMTTK